MGSSTISADHDFVAATYVPITAQQARHVERRGAFWLREPVRVDVLELLCRNCKKHYDDVVDQPCSAAESTEHLRGGPIGERKKRTAAG